MAYTIKKQSVRVLLDNGTDAQGNTKTVSINLGDMSETGFDPTQGASRTAVMAIVGALEPCLNKSVDSVEAITTAGISAA